MLGVGEGLGWAGLGCGGSPQLSLLNVPWGPRTITIDLLQVPSALVSQTSKGSPIWRVPAGCMRDILYETDYSSLNKYLDMIFAVLYPYHISHNMLPASITTDSGVLESPADFSLQGWGALGLNVVKHEMGRL